MSKHVRKLLLALICISVASTSLVGCGKSEEKSKDNKVTTKSVEKPQKITWGISSGLTEKDGRDEFKKKFKELTGVELDIFAPTTSYYESLDASISSGTAPDVMFFASYYSKYVGKKVLLDLTNYIKNSDATKNISKDELAAVTLDGKVYGVPTETGDGKVTYVRKDWLDKLGLKEPKTYTEFYNMLKAFKNIKAPNGATTIPMTAAKVIDYTGLVEFYQDAVPDFIKKNGKWVDGFTEPEMKGALDRLASAYKDGLLDPEVFTNNSGMCRDKFSAGRVGVYDSWAGFWAENFQKLLQNGPAGKDASVIPIKAIQGVKYQGRTPTVNTINASAKNPDGIWKTFFETLFDGKEGSKLFTLGVEGVHFKTSDDKKIQGLPMKSNSSSVYQKSYYPTYAMSVPVSFNYNYSEWINKSKEVLKESIQIPELTPTSSTRSKKGGDILKLVESLIGKVVKGEITSDEAIKKYKAQAEENQIDKILKELNNN